MKRLTRMMTAMLVVAALCLAGCMTARAPMTIQDHPSPQKNITTIETKDTWVYYFVFGAIIQNYHKFWNCVELTDSVVCASTCDGKNDLTCPLETISVQSNGNGGTQTTTTSNTR